MNKFLKASAILLVTARCLIADEGGSPFRFPDRIIGGARVNLVTLFDWWRKATPLLNNTTKLRTNDQQRAMIDMRPLRSWVRISGYPSEELPFGWRMSATIEDIPGHIITAEIFIFNPPAEEKNRFAFLTNRLAILNDFQSRASTAASGNLQSARELGAQEQNLSVIGSSSQFLHDQVEPNRSAYALAARRAAIRSEVFYKRSDQASSEIERVRGELYSMPGHGNYCVDYFALRTGQKFEGLDVYDIGMRVAATQ